MQYTGKVYRLIKKIVSQKYKLRQKLFQGDKRDAPNFINYTSMNSYSKP